MCLDRLHDNFSANWVHMTITFVPSVLGHFSGAFGRLLLCIYLYYYYEQGGKPWLYAAMSFDKLKYNAASPK
jgi:hypothetical protein